MPLFKRDPKEFKWCRFCPEDVNEPSCEHVDRLFMALFDPAWPGEQAHAKLAKLAKQDAESTPKAS